METLVYISWQSWGILEYETLKFCPSVVAASAVYAARCTDSGLDGDAQVSPAADNEMKIGYMKYLTPERVAAALLPPAKDLLPASISS
ncbi:G2/mitotic-specific cyclin S13-7-like [Rutidosis leptorrhynchoides]|uniref:G2/mitotic-specific cyclin S13-7-like n=1 Tax=Rutidosis leptorrhynchoides TaxID=125765 RepID=UPI003A997C6E